MNRAVAQPKPRPPRIEAQWYRPPAVGNADATWPIVSAMQSVSALHTGRPMPMPAPPTLQEPIWNDVMPPAMMQMIENEIAKLEKPPSCAAAPARSPCCGRLHVVGDHALHAARRGVCARPDVPLRLTAHERSPFVTGLARGRRSPFGPRQDRRVSPMSAPPRGLARTHAAYMGARGPAQGCARAPLLPSSPMAASTIPPLSRRRALLGLAALAAPSCRRGTSPPGAGGGGPVGLEGSPVRARLRGRRPAARAAPRARGRAGAAAARRAARARRGGAGPRGRRARSGATTTASTRP